MNTDRRAPWWPMGLLAAPWRSDELSNIKPSLTEFAFENETLRTVLIAVLAVDQQDRLAVPADYSGVPWFVANVIPLQPPRTAQG